MFNRSTIAQFVFMFVMSVTSSGALAQDKSNGCGPGWYVTKNISFSATTTRATTNSYVTPFAMTSGTSGCAKHTIVKVQNSYEFIAMNQDQVNLEMSQGRGEYLTNLAQMMNCPVDVDLGAALQKDFEFISGNLDMAEAVIQRTVKVCKTEDHQS
jgi:hypothetical protein